MTGPRTVTVHTLDHGPVTLTCPAWCTGEHDESDVFRVDLAHDGVEHVIAPAGRELFRAFLTQAPFSNVDRSIGLYVEAADITITHTPEGIEQFADELTAAAEQLRVLGRELARILAGGGR